MTVLYMWFSEQNILLVVLLSIVSIAAGALLRMKIPKKKIFLMFGAAFLYLIAEYSITELGKDGTKSVMLGGIAGMFLLGVALPSAFMPWTFAKTKESKEKNE